MINNVSFIPSPRLDSPPPQPTPSQKTPDRGLMPESNLLPSDPIPARRFNSRSPVNLPHLSGKRKNPEVDNVGGNVQQAAHDISNPFHHYLLENMAALENAKIPALNGENVEALAARHGITNPFFKWHLYTISGMGAKVRAGENVYKVAVEHWAVDEHSLELLEGVAVNGPALTAVRAGANIHDVAMRHGITNDFFIALLENEAVEGPAGAAIRRDGAKAADVINTYGITGPYFQKQLQALESQPQ